MEQFQPEWHTTEEFAGIHPVNLLHKEQDTGEAPSAARKNVHVLARARISLARPEQGLFLRLTGDDYYKLYVNGEFVTQGPAPSDPGHYYYSAVPLEGLLKEGANIIGVHLYYQGLVNRVFYSGDGRLALAGDLADGEGRSVFRLRWEYRDVRAYSGRPTGYDTQFLENFDSRQWDENWNRETCSQEPWRPMVPAPWADYRLFPQPVSPVAVYEREPERIQKRGRVWEIDMGEEVTGALEIRARGTAGSQVVIRCGEELSENGSPRHELRCGCSYEEMWTLGEGECVYHPFDYKGFRYARITAEKGVKLQAVRAVLRHYPVNPQDFCLKASEPLLPRIADICRRAVICGCQEGFLDCPTREKGQYLGDAVVTAHSHLWLTGKTELLRKCICQFEDTGRVCPGLMAVAPGGLMQEIGDFSLLWPELVMLDYQFTGDREFLRERLRALRGLLEHFRRYAGEDGLLHQVADKWNLVDWPENLRDGYDFPLTRPVVGEGCHNVMNALYIGAGKRLWEMERILGEEGDRGWMELREAFVKRFYDQERGIFKDRKESGHASLHSNIYPLYFGLVPEGREGEAADYLISRGLSCGVFLSYFYLKALAGAGRHQAVYDTVLNPTRHGWVNMLREGATACFEAWGKDQKWNTSLCHPWASAPIPVLVEDLAGFMPCPSAEEGFVFQPRLPQELAFLSLEIPFRGKRWRVRWEKGEGRLEQL